MNGGRIQLIVCSVYCEQTGQAADTYHSRTATSLLRPTTPIKYNILLLPATIHSSAGSCSKSNRVAYVIIFVAIYLNSDDFLLNAL